VSINTPSEIKCSGSLWGKAPAADRAARAPLHRPPTPALDVGRKKFVFGRRSASVQ
jgi:hypothetical protein